MMLLHLFMMFEGFGTQDNALTPDLTGGGVDAGE